MLYILFTYHEIIITFFSHTFKSIIPTFPRIGYRPNDDLIIIHLKLNIIPDPDLLKEGFRDTDSLGISNFYDACSHIGPPSICTNIVITSRFIVKSLNLEEQRAEQRRGRQPASVCMPWLSKYLFYINRLLYNIDMIGFYEFL